MNMFNNSKYGNLLTVILIISIIAIIGIVIIVGYRMYKAYYIETGALGAASEFENMVGLGGNNSTGGQVDDGNLIEIEDTYGSGNGNGQVTTYKGFPVVGTIQIPSIKLKYPILGKNTPKSLQTSVVLMYTAAGLNEVGNSVVIGHNYRNGTMFSNVDKLKKEDVIYITDMQGRKVKYTIYDIYRTSGSDARYITRNTQGKREISLSTCTDDSKARTIVLAREG